MNRTPTMSGTTRRPKPDLNRSPRALPRPPVQWAEPVTYPDEVAPSRKDNRSAARRRQDAGMCRVLNAFKEKLD